MSQTLRVIQRCFTNFYPKESNLLIVGSRRGDPIGVHKILRVGFVEEKSIDGVYLGSSETDKVNVQSLCLESSQQLNEGVFKEMYAFDALLFVIEDGEFEEQSLGRMREIIKKVVGEFHEDKDEPVVALVINSRGSKAAKIATISREFRGLLKNFGHRKVFCTPATRLGLLNVLDFIGDELTIKSRKKLRMVWKERRREARWRFDERQEAKKEKKAELKRKRKEKEAKAEKKHYSMLHREAREGYSTEEEEGGTSSRSDSEEEEKEEESESSFDRMSNSD